MNSKNKQAEMNKKNEVKTVNSDSQKKSAEEIAQQNKRAPREATKPTAEEYAYFMYFRAM